MSAVAEHSPVEPSATRYSEDNTSAMRFVIVLVQLSSYLAPTATVEPSTATAKPNSSSVQLLSGEPFSALR